MSDYIQISKAQHDAFKAAIAHDNKWRNLFTSNGLAILFPSIKRNAISKVNQKHIMEGKLY
jgi:hypothetical protein